MPNTENWLAAPLDCSVLPELLRVEVASSLQIPGLHIVGLPGTEVAESRERARAAILASGLELPKRRVVLNLSPAGIRKRGTATDLAIALGILLERESGPKGRWVASGELGLDGRIKPVGRPLRTLHAAWRNQADFVLVPSEGEARCHRLLESLRGELPGCPPRIVAAANLREAFARLQSGQEQSSSATPEAGGIAVSTRLAGSGVESARLARNDADSDADRAQVPGSDPLRSGPTEPESSSFPPAPEGLLPIPSTLSRALAAAVAGSHHLLLLGPRGVGKSHALEWLAALAPVPTRSVRTRRALVEELRLGIEVEGAGAQAVFARALDIAPDASLGSMPGSAKEAASWIRRVGPQVRPPALIGAFRQGAPVPGELTLADGGWLFADEFPEWHRDSREALREPLERGKTCLNRVDGKIELDADFTLAATGNLCPCGGWSPELPRPEHAPSCICPKVARERYEQRISGPVLDRIDLRVVVSTAPGGHPGRDAQGELLRIRDDIARARRFLQGTWGAPSGKLPAARIEELLAQLATSVHELAGTRSLRDRHKRARIALTFAALDGEPFPRPRHFQEAGFYRS